MRTELEGCVIHMNEAGDTEVEVTLPNGRVYRVHDDTGNATALATCLIFGFDKGPEGKVTKEMIERSIEETNYT